MGSMYAWHSTTQCDKLLDSVMALLPLTEVSQGISGDEPHNSDNGLTRITQTHMHADTHQHMNGHSYTSCSPSTPGLTTFSNEDLHLLDCLPMLAEDMFFLTQSLPNMDFACDDWGLPSHEDLFSPKPEGDCLFENQNNNVDQHEAHDQHYQHDASQPFLDYNLCVSIEPAMQNCCNESSIEDLVIKESSMATAPCPNEVTGMVSPHTESSSKPKRRVLKRQKSVVKVDTSQRLESSDLSDGMEDEESDKLDVNGKARGSKNLVSERKRRMKLNEKLYSLRAIVPKISKMDKASIVADAISHVQELQKKKKSMQEAILALQANKGTTQEGLSSCMIEGIDTQYITEDLSQHKIIELDVWNMEPRTYNLRIHCKKGPGVLVQLTKALEALDFEIVNANLTTVNDHFLNAVIVKAESDEELRQEDVKEMMVQMFPMFGLHF